MPGLTFVEVDWAKVSSESQTNVMSAAYRLAALAVFQSAGIDTLVRELQWMQREARRLNTAFYELMRDASKKSWASMERSVATYQSRVDEAKLIRDLSGAS